MGRLLWAAPLHGIYLSESTLNQGRGSGTQTWKLDFLSKLRIHCSQPDGLTGQAHKKRMCKLLRIYSQKYIYKGN